MKKRRAPEGMGYQFEIKFNDGGVRKTRALCFEQWWVGEGMLIVDHDDPASGFWAMPLSNIREFSVELVDEDDV